MTGAIMVIGWLVSAVVGAIIGLAQGKPGKGALLGFFFGPLGWILMILDAGWALISGVIIVLALAVAVIVAAVMVEMGRQEDRERLARIERQSAEEAASRERWAIAAGDAVAPQPIAAPSSEPTPKPILPSVTWSAFPPGVDTPEQRRAYLQQLAEAKRQREGEGKR
jgi:uncharacterized membrane protein